MKKYLFLFFLAFVALPSIAQPPPLSPTNLAVVQVGLTNTVSATWTAPTSGTLTGYKVYFSSPTTPLDSISTTSNSVVIPGLNYNQVYSIYVKSYRNLIPTGTSKSMSTSIVTVTLLNLVAPNISIDGISVTHNKFIVAINDTNTSETSFDIEIEENDIITTYTQTPGTLVYKTISNLKPKTFYRIRARARYNSTSGPWSSFIYQKTNVDFPPSAQLSYDLNCPNLIHIKWNIPARSEDIEGYVLKKSYNGIDFYDLNRPNLGSSDYYDQTALSGSNQQYILYTTNKTGGTPSNTLTVYAQGYAKPNAPSFLISDQGNKSRNHLTIKWTNGTEDQQCKTNIRTNTIVKVKINNSGDYVDYANIPGYASSIKIDKLNPKDIVDVLLFAVSDKGLMSDASSVRDTTAGPPYAPSDPIAVFYYDALGNPSYNISWKDNSKDEDYFIIERSTDNKTFIELGKIKMELVSFKDLTPEEATIYYYRVKAGSNTEGESDYSQSIGPFIINPSKAPNAPYGLRALESAGKVNLTWYDDSIREENYIIEKSQDGGISFILVATLGKNITNYTDENVSAGKSYLYRVTAKNIVASSNFSNIASIKMSGVGLSPNEVSINIFPNPTFEKLNITADNLKNDVEYNLRVYDRNNRQIINQQIKLKQGQSFEVPLEKFSQGLYNVVISNSDTNITRKIFKY